MTESNQSTANQDIQVQLDDKQEPKQAQQAQQAQPDAEELAVKALLEGQTFAKDIAAAFADGKLEAHELIPLALQLAKLVESGKDVLHLKGEAKLKLVLATLRFLIQESNASEELRSKALVFIDTTVPYAVQAAILVSKGFQFKDVAQTVAADLLPKAAELLPKAAELLPDAVPLASTCFSILCVPTTKKA